MARIPGSEGLGQLTPQVQRTQTQQASSAVAQGAARLGQAIGGLVDEEIALQNQRREEADRLKTAAGLSQYEADLRNLTTNVQNELSGGSIATRDEAFKRFQSESSVLAAGLYEKLPAKMKQAAQLRAGEISTAQEGLMGQFLDRHATSEARGDLNTLSNSLSTTALGSEAALATAKDQFRTALDANGRALRYTPEEQAKMIADFNGNATYSHYAEQMAARPGDIAYIRNLKTRLADNKQLTDLDEAKRIQLQHAATSLEDRWMAAQERAKAKAEASLAVDAADMRDFALNGGDITKLSKQDRRRFDIVLASEKYGKNARGWLDINQKVANFNQLPITQQGAALDAMAAEHRATTDVDKYNQQTDVLQAMNAKYAANAQAYKADPLTYTAVNTLNEEVQPINWSNMAGVPAQLRARKDQAARATQVSGTRVPVVTADDATAIATIAGAMSPQQSAKLLSTIRQAVGDENMTGVSAMMGKAADPVFVGASLIAGQRTDAGRDPAEIALRGRDVIKNKEIQLPTEDKLRAQFAAATNLTGTALEVGFATAQAIYAARAKERGVIEPLAGKPDSKLWNDAIQLSTGGAYEYNGRRLVAPNYGQSQSAFEDRVSGIRTEDVQRAANGRKILVDGQPVSYDKAAAYIREAPLANGGGAGLVIVRAGMGYLMTDDGKVLQIGIPK